MKNKIDITFHRDKFIRVKTRRLHYPQCNCSTYQQVRDSCCFMLLIKVEGQFTRLKCSNSWPPKTLFKKKRKRCIKPPHHTTEPSAVQRHCMYQQNGSGRTTRDVSEAIVCFLVQHIYTIRQMIAHEVFRVWHFGIARITVWLCC